MEYQTKGAIENTISLLESCGAMEKVKEYGGTPFLKMALQNIIVSAIDDYVRLEKGPVELMSQVEIN